MKDTLKSTALGVIVVTGWMLALIWLAVSVTQIAVNHTMVGPCSATGRLVPAEQINDPLGVTCSR